MKESMQEYTHTPRPKPLQETALFEYPLDDAFNDEVATPVAESEKPEPASDPNLDPHPGVAIPYDYYKVLVRTILTSINDTNRAEGAQKASRIPDSNYRRRYKDPEAVASSQAYSSGLKEAQALEAQRVLTAEGALYAHGVVDDIGRIAVRRAVRETIESYRGTGPKQVAKRRKLLKKLS